MHSRSVAATWNGCTPMSMSRVITPAAEFVWSELNTRCPVSAALMAMSAESKSRISPIMITSGSLRRMVRSAVSNRSLSAVSTSDWATPTMSYSTGSSTVMIRPGIVGQPVPQRGVERGRLAAAGGAGEQDHALLLAGVLDERVVARPSTCRAG